MMLAFALAFVASAGVRPAEAAKWTCTFITKDNKTFTKKAASPPAATSAARKACQAKSKTCTFKGCN